MSRLLRPLRRRLAALAVAVAALPIAAIGAVPSAVSPVLKSLGWEEITFDGEKLNRFEACAEDCIAVETDESVSMIGRPVSVDLTTMPVLKWEWRIEQPVAASDLTAKGADDRAIAVYVTFPYDPDTASLAEKLLRPVVELARGRDAPSRMISYVWAGFGRRGELIESPYFGGVNAIVVMRNGGDKVGSWVVERADVMADHRRAFGYAPRTAAHLLIGADSDDTRTRGRARVRNIAFDAE